MPVGQQCLVQMDEAMPAAATALRMIHSTVRGLIGAWFPSQHQVEDGSVIMSCPLLGTQTVHTDGNVGHESYLELLPNTSETFPGPLSVLTAVQCDTAVWVLPRSHVVLQKLLREPAKDRKQRRENDSQSKHSNVFGSPVRLEIPRNSMLVFR